MVIFLKLGGSLITDKDKPLTAKIRTINRIGREISSALNLHNTIKLVVGHGSGSFGHSVAKKYGTRDGIKSEDDWLGFQKVWHAARDLNQIVIDHLINIEIPIISFPPSAYLTSSNGKLESWNYYPILSALDHKLVPLIYGDVIFDQSKGSTIFSTEDLFSQLADILHPDLILLAGKEPGVWKDFPKNNHIIKHLDPESYHRLYFEHIQSSSSPDVTGGMISKINLMLDVVVRLPQTRVMIFSGKEPGNILSALMGNHLGTMITADR